ncbi:MAG: hypothetical protein Ta2E_06290 [Mycoplasmoidaceae bacterium]|nr:MAG: hypothetical protein Ta2E_06290 [Mycoplasmoidaceae bacterium]
MKGDMEYKELRKKFNNIYHDYWISKEVQNYDYNEEREKFVKIIEVILRTMSNKELIVLEHVYKHDIGWGYSRASYYRISKDSMEKFINNATKLLH